MSLGFSVCKIKFVFDREIGKPIGARAIFNPRSVMYNLWIAEYLVLLDFKTRTSKVKYNSH